MKRKFITGSEWLYCKIYAGINTQDKLLKTQLYDIVCNLYNTGCIDKFFFVRYEDELGYHLRLRFHLKNRSDYIVALNLLYQNFENLVDTRYVQSIVLDVYEREIERYGSDTIECVEEILSANSWLVINYLRANVEKNWIDSVSITNELLDQFCPSPKEKLEVIEQLYKHFQGVEPNKARMRNHLQDIHKKNKQNLLDAMTINPWELLMLYKFSDKKKSKEMQNAYYESINKIKSKLAVDNRELMEGIVKSLVHMSFNRFFSFRQNTHEMIVYYMMSKVYQTQCYNFQQL